MEQLGKIPGVGHGVFLIYAACGDDEKAEEAFISANRSTLVIAGSIVGGPAGGAAGGASADVINSAIIGRNVGVVRDVEDIFRDVDKGRVPWRGAGNLAVRTGFDALCGKGIEKRIVRGALRPCLGLPRTSTPLGTQIHPFTPN